MPDIRDMTLTQKQYSAFVTDANEILFGGASGAGKLLCLKTHIRTTDGWKIMGDVHPGDKVYDENGQTCNVIAESSIDYNEDTYKITFDDHAEIIAGARHQWVVIDRACQKTIYKYLPNERMYNFDWPVYDSNDFSQKCRKDAPKTKVMTTEEMATKIKVYGRHYNLRIPVTKHLEFSEKKLLLHPWLMGVLLGDGDTLGTGRIACHPEDKQETIDIITSLGYKIGKSNSPDHLRVNGIRGAWRSLNLHEGKYIPREYIEGSIEQRRELISGMLDSDGSVKDDGRCVFTNTNKILIDGFMDICYSLGYKPALVVFIDKKHPTWKTRYDVLLNTDYKFCKLKRKSEKIRLKHNYTQYSRTICAIEKIENHPKKCIQVDSPNNLYLIGKELIPTHNSHLMRYASIFWALTIPGIQIYLFRRKYADLEKNHLYGPNGYVALLDNLRMEKKVKINYSSLRLDFTNGSKIFLCHCNHDKDRFNYQGAEIHVLLIDELTHFSKEIYTFLRSRVRLGSFKIDYESLKDQFPFLKKGFFPRILCGTNPGGVGHSVFKTMFVDSAPPNTVWKTPPIEGGMRRVYLPALVWENPFLLNEDPEYMLRLKGLGDKYMVAAMLTGDWDIIAGGALDDIWKRDKHVIEPFEIPSDWRIDRTFDWGSAHPFAVGWFAESNGNPVILADGSRKTFPRGTVFLIDELYGWTGEPNVGSRKTTREQGAMIREKEVNVYWGPRVRPGPGDSSIFDKVYAGKEIESMHDGLVLGYNNYDEQIAKEVNQNSGIGGSLFKFHKKKIDRLFVEANKSPGSRVKGLEAIRTYLKASLVVPMENKGLFIFSNCIQWIRTVPVLPRDENNVEDIDCFIAGTKVLTSCGDKNIEDCVVGDMAWTPTGFRRISEAELSGNSKCVIMTLDTGTELQGTPDHKIFIHGKGLIPLEEVIKGDIVWETQLQPKSIEELNIDFILKNDILRVALLMLNDLENQCSIDKFGKMLTEKFPKIVVSITKIIIPQIMKWKIWNSKISVNTRESIFKRGWLKVATCVRNYVSLMNLSVVRRLNVKMLEKCMREHPTDNLRAIYVESLLELNEYSNYTALRNVLKLQDEKEMLGKYVKFVGMNFMSRIIIPTQQKHVVTNVDGSLEEEQQVYHLTVDQVHLFYANGVLVTNTATEDHFFDLTRYKLFTKQVEYKKLSVTGL